LQRACSGVHGGWKGGFQEKEKELEKAERKKPLKRVEYLEQDQ